MKVVVTGMIASYPIGGVFWDYFQYALGLEQMGFDVYYLEDTGAPLLDPVSGQESLYGVQFLKGTLEILSPTLSRKWLVRTMTDQFYGMPRQEMEEAVADADLFLNVSGCCLLRQEYLRSRRKVLIDTDPGWNHFLNYPKWDREPGWLGANSFREHDYFFTYAQRMGSPDCLLPSLGLDWKKTRPLVCLDQWQAKRPAEKWSTVMSWNNYRKDLEYEGKKYGSKEKEFPNFERLPKLIPVGIEAAVGGNDAPRERWRGLGWSIIDPTSVSRTADQYRAYVQGSRGEFSVAKNVYVATRSGWFSCRSVCYLAAGLPVVLQDTGFSRIIPTGAGVMAFDTLDEAVKCIKNVEADYKRHSDAAREIAQEYFSSDVVLKDIFNKIGLR